VVTGANSGIGFEIALALAEMQAHVVLVCRDTSRGKEAVTAIKARCNNSNIDLVRGDLGTIAGTRQLAIELQQRYPLIHVLVNNAGVWMTRKHINADGLELSFMVNHLAPFMLNRLLRPSLIAAAPARIININAGLYIKGTVDIERTPYGADFGRFKTYANSKLCNVLTLAGEAQELEGSAVTLNHVHPGVIQTALGDSKGVLGWLMRQIKKSWLTPAQGAVAPVWLATAEEIATISGAYFNEKAQIPIDARAQDETLARQVRDFSIRVAGLPC